MIKSNLYYTIKYKNQINLSIKFITLFFITSTSIFAQNFEKLNTQNLKGGYIGFSSFVDYNNDGFLDIFVTGLDFENRFTNAVFYENNGDLSFTESEITNIPRTIYGDYSWGDFDNNNTQDFLYSGTTSGFSEEGITKVYRNLNNGCEFIELPLALPGISKGSSEWVDIDNDGLLDIFLAGFDINDKIIIKAYKNSGNDNFVDQDIPTIERFSGGRGNFTRNKAKWEDLDGDGLQDLIIALSNELDFTFEIYKNLGGFQFAKQNIGLPKLSSIAMDIGDINNDGLIDIIFTGSPNLENNSGDGTGDFYVFTNNGNMNFTNSFTIADEGVFFNDVELGDIDNDGFLDAVNYGTGPWGNHPEITKIYKNNGDNTFSNFSHNLPDCRFGGIEFGDFDNDNDLDILYFGRIEDPFDNEITYIYKNDLINIDLPTEILITQSCSCDNTLNFSLNNNYDSIQWRFDDPSTGMLNTSDDKKTSHLFSSEGNYTVSATFSKGSITSTLTKNVNLIGLPTLTEPQAITSCNNDTSTIEYDLNALKDAEILNGASLDDFEIYYYTSYQNSEKDQYRLPIPYINQNINETIYVRVQKTTNSNCFVLTDFDIIIETPPILNPINDLIVCAKNLGGYAEFNLTNIPIELINSQSNLFVELIDSNNNLISASDYNNFVNHTANQDYVKAIVTNSITNCSSEININLIVNDNPIANQLQIIYGCDDNNDGISEYFDISNVENQVLNGQTGMTVSYFDQSGNQLPIPLPNPYTNSNSFIELITVRVANNNSTCYAETSLQMQTVTQPNINQLNNLFACDQGNGYAEFDTLSIEQELIGNQTGLTIQYFDSDNNPLPSPLPILLQNTEPFSQTISIRVEDASNPICYSETSLKLIVNELPIINLENEYFICDLEPSISLNVDSGYNSYNWFFEDGTLISSTNSAEITEEGSYTLTVIQIENGIPCENSFDFKLTSSVLPEIQQVNYGELGNNFIEIIAIGDGVFEYSIDGINYQDSNYFTSNQRGIYTVFVRDKNGCGQDSEEVTIIDYPKFFTPNNDGYNDFWQITGINNFLNSEIFIFDRYGKLLKQVSQKSLGWDGFYNGKKMPSNDYWFKVNLSNGKIFSGHFTLKR